MYKNSIPFLIFLFSFAAPVIAAAQNDMKDTTDVSDLAGLLERGEANAASKKSYTKATFKTTRIANGHSIENTAKGVLDFRINHRFGQLDEGIKNFFGLDNAVTRIGADYGITDWLMIGVGRSTHLRDYDGFVKVKLLRQTDDDAMPISMSYLGAISISDNNITIPLGAEYPFSNRVAYINQLLIARKFSNWLSLQLMPTHIHYNFVQYRDDPNDVLAIGLGGRIKLSNRIALTGEYYYVLPDNKLRDTRNSLTLGFDIETGGHVFQLMFTNSTGINERMAIGQTTGRWDKGDIRFGFNISRIFTIVRPKEFKNSRNKIW